MVSSNPRDESDSRARVEVLVDLSQPLAVDVRVDLRRRDVRMAEHDLHGSQIGAPLQKMRREGVAQHMRAEPGSQTDGAAMLLENFPEPLPAHRAAAVVEKEGRVRRAPQNLRTGAVQIGPNPRYGLASERDHALLAPLADAPEVTRLQVEVALSQRDQLRDSQPRGVEHLHHGRVAQSERAARVWRGEQVIDLLEGEVAWQRLQGSRGADLRGGILGDHLLHHQVTVEHAHGVKGPRDRFRRQPLSRKPSRELVDLSLTDLTGRTTLRGQVAAELREIAPVREDRVLRQPALDREVMEEILDQVGGLHRDLPSRIRVTGPSFTSSTSINSRKRPVAIVSALC